MNPQIWIVSPLGVLTIESIPNGVPRLSLGIVSLPLGLSVSNQLERRRSFRGCCMARFAWAIHSSACGTQPRPCARHSGIASSTPWRAFSSSSVTRSSSTSSATVARRLTPLRSIPGHLVDHAAAADDLAPRRLSRQRDNFNRLQLVDRFDAGGLDRDDKLRLIAAPTS